VGPLEYGVGEHVVDCAADSTPVLDKGESLPIVGGLTGRQWMPLGAGQPLWMQDIQQKLVTFFLIQQILNWKTYHIPYANISLFDSPYILYERRL
jgi:hypothetical protein